MGEEQHHNHTPGKPWDFTSGYWDIKRDFAREWREHPPEVCLFVVYALVIFFMPELVYFFG